MTTTTEIIELKEYDTIGILADEEDALNSFSEHSGYICDAVSEIADSYIPIYNYDVWANASDIQEYIEEALASGLVDTTGDIDLIKIFQAGYYEYYSQSLNNNLDAMTYNYVANKVNEYLNTLEDVEGIDLDEVESEISDATTNYDHNNDFDDLEGTANDIIERIKENEFEL